MLEVIDRKLVLIGIYKSIKYSNSIFYITRTLKLSMPSKPKGFRREYSSEIISVLFELKNSGQSHCEIAYHLEISKSSVTTILYREVRQSDNSPKPSKQLGCPPKLDFRAQQAIIYYVKKFLHDNLHALSTPFKSGHTIGRTTIWQYLKAASFFRFKARKKPFLSNKHKAAR